MATKQKNPRVVFRPTPRKVKPLEEVFDNEDELLTFKLGQLAQKFPKRHGNRR